MHHRQLRGVVTQGASSGHANPPSELHGRSRWGSVAQSEGAAARFAGSRDLTA